MTPSLGKFFFGNGNEAEHCPILADESGFDTLFATSGDAEHVNALVAICSLLFQENLD